MSNRNLIFEISHKGNLRKINEDAMGRLQNDEFDLFVVCDGLGGEAKGDIASKLAVKEITDYFKSLTVITNINDEIKSSISKANQTILEITSKNPDSEGMGTTCAIAVISEGKLFLGNVGNSRIYIFSSDKFQQLSKDDSFVQKLLDKNLINEDEAKNHPRRKELSQALGFNKNIYPQLLECPVNIEQNDLILLCTDGLHNSLDSIKLKKILIQEKEVQEIGNKILNLALGNGDEDNITYQIIKVETGDKNITETNTLPADQYILEPKSSQQNIKIQDQNKILDNKNITDTIKEDSSNNLPDNNLSNNEWPDNKKLWKKMRRVLIFFGIIHYLVEIMLQETSGGRVNAASAIMAVIIQYVVSKAIIKNQISKRKLINNPIILAIGISLLVFIIRVILGLIILNAIQ
tara:strand:- start:4872 stop:6089 length:1218 start_codon:yes stop_codon:yes gene_type:complete